MDGGVDPSNNRLVDGFDWACSLGRALQHHLVDALGVVTPNLNELALHNQVGDCFKGLIRSLWFPCPSCVRKTEDDCPQPAV